MRVNRRMLIIEKTKVLWYIGQEKAAYGMNADISIQVVVVSVPFSVLAHWFGNRIDVVVPRLDIDFLTYIFSFDDTP